MLGRWDRCCKMFACKSSEVNTRDTEMSLIVLPSECIQSKSKYIDKGISEKKRATVVGHEIEQVCLEGVLPSKPMLRCWKCRFFIRLFHC